MADIQRLMDCFAGGLRKRSKNGNAIGSADEDSAVGNDGNEKLVWVVLSVGILIRGSHIKLGD
jgi:hypothetical protein